MRISDWSSDVCSSDLAEQLELPRPSAAASSIGTQPADGAFPRQPAVSPRGCRHAAKLSGGRPCFTGLLCSSSWRSSPVSSASAELLPLPPASRRSFSSYSWSSEEHTSELQSLMRISYDVFCLN